MPGTKLVLAGDAEAAEAVATALRGKGIQPRIVPAASMPEALVGMERELSDDRPEAAVTVGAGEAALALAITAGKLGVPTAAVGAGAAGAKRADEARILTTLASFDAGSDPLRAAELIASWLRERVPAT